jgi:pilus assembly protein CpaB
MIAISVQLTDPQRVAGNVYPGSEVAIFTSGLGGPGHAGGASVSSGSASAVGEAALLLPKVLVLNVGDPVPLQSTTTDEAGNQTTETLPRTLLTIAVNQSEAQKIITVENSPGGGLTLGLLTGTSQIHMGPGTTVSDLWKK